MRALLAPVLCALASLTLACGGGSFDLAQWQQLTEEVRVDVQTHRLSVENAPDRAECERLRTAYLDQVGPKMERMRQMASELGGCRSMHGEGDLQMGCRRMDDALAGYAQGGCASDDAAINQAQAFGHCDQMLARLDELDQTGARMMGPGGGMMMGGCRH
jgi:hypothetical protein